LLPLINLKDLSGMKKKLKDQFITIK